MHLTVDGEEYDVTHSQLRTLMEANVPFSPWAERLWRLDDRVNQRLPQEDDVSVQGSAESSP